MGVLVARALLLVLLCLSQSYSQSHEVEDLISRIKRYEESSWAEPNECSRSRAPPLQFNPYNMSVDLRMPGVTPTTSDAYLCTAVTLPYQREAYIVDFVPHATMETVHHMMLYGCRTPVSTKGYWDCGTELGTCEDEAKIMYAWARNAPPTKLPKDVGFKVGGESRITHFVLQIHYGDISAFKDHHRDCSGLTLTMTTKPQPFIAGMYLMMSVDTVILPGKRVTNADIACAYESYPMHPFAFRTHTHRLGQVVSGYRVRDGKWTLIGRQSPQLPQAFYPVSNSIAVEYGDTLAARCVFTGEGRTTKTRIGGTSQDEMCNFYIMYYMENKHAVPYMDCMERGPAQLFRNIPPEASEPIPVAPDHMMGSMMHSSAHDADHQDDKALLEPKRAEEDGLDLGGHLEEVSGWPQASLPLGQVSGLALDSDDNLVIFHRGDHVWSFRSFDGQERYLERSLGPIRQAAILVVDPSTGTVLRAAGRNTFYLPHGITTDQDNNYWVTDVALHQVMKLSADGKGKPLLVLGEAFVPGSDERHFCKPTDVTLDPATGNVFVADGYCNHRILTFSPTGKYLKQWGAGYTDRRHRLPFQIPHSLAFLPERRQVCVADRENGRIQCFQAETGELMKEIRIEEFGGEVFAVAYAPGNGGRLYAVNGEPPSGVVSAPLRGFVVDYTSKEVLDTFSPESQEFRMPHDIVVSSDGSVFVADVQTNSVFKFLPGGKAEHRSVKKGGIQVQEIQETETILQARVKPIPHAALPPAVQKALEGPIRPNHPSKTQTQLHQLQQQQQTPQEAPQQPGPPGGAAPEPPLGPDASTQHEKEKEAAAVAKEGSGEGVSPAVVTTLLLVPLVVVLAVGVFVRWRKTHMYSDDYEVKLDPNSSGGILGKLRGKAAGTLNLGNFFASRQGYARQGFDRLNTEGSDQEKDDEDATDSENEEYAAPPLPPISSS